LKKFDVVLLTDHRYVVAKTNDQYTKNVFTEDGLVEQALNNLGLATIKKDWNDPNFDWSSTKLALFRTTWDYFDRFPAFRKWLDEVKNKCSLINTYEQINWNLDKHYLKDLKKNGVRIPKSIFVKKEKNKNLSLIAMENGWEEIVVKPTVSGAARHTYRLSGGEIENFESKWKELSCVEDFIIQEFQKNIITKGEVAIMLFGGEYTHSVLKKAKSGDFRVQDDFGGSVIEYNPSSEMINIAKKAIKNLLPIPAYARVDLIWDNDNKIAVSELELIEPELWFRFNTKSADLLAFEVKEYLKNLN